ncbi:TetR/AcrR family transcriptional regulator [Shewanella glacialipiscicola]|uniref:TetR/AcrR family transcriptional regulator n=1 Tax=Shewanella glacialipiscicola TaxID=614069 RepID=UPI0021D8B271|nr:TetR/AcrR family transcriptional regulator [Shewanella glacialipiscicola]MCU7993968.1 TetR/AcrR family transcriptional regulator [Shewanella glacialipiscicola]MCU8025286.1 TetR/AcrR family transcriptional regulator [Shewanella glacialipiscicola]
MRNAEFDREQVLRGAMAAFMHKGYTKTSMQDLTQATGLHPGSIYCAFTNKRGLLIAAIEQYQLDRSEQFNRLFANNDNVLANFKTYLDYLVIECLSCDSGQVCLLTKALNEIAEQDVEIQNIINQYLQAMQLALMQQFAAAKLQGLLQGHRSSEQRAQYLMMGIYGLRTFAHTHPEAETLQHLAEQLLTDVCQ